MKPLAPFRHRAPAAGRGQRGVVMLFGLLALVIMLIGTVAMVRSMNTALLSSGNLGFKRDLTNQGERAVAVVLTALQSGALAAPATRNNHLVGSNYRASIMATNAQGLPEALVRDSLFSTVGSSANDISVPDQGITVRYVVDRLCTTTGAPTVDNCTMADPLLPTGGSSSEGNTSEFGSVGGGGAIGAQVIYRVSIRVTGPRQTQAYFQTTMTL